MTSNLERLTARMPPPPTPAAVSRSWEEVEAAYGLRFPPDYRAVLETYGSGSVGGEMVWVDPRRPAFDEPAAFVLGLLRGPDGGFAPLPAFPAGGPSLFPVATNGNGDNVFLIVRDGVAHDDQLWVGHVAERDWARVPGPFSAFVYSVVSGASELAEQLGAVWDLRPIFIRITGTRAQYAGRLLGAPAIEPRDPAGALDRLQAWVLPPDLPARPDRSWREAEARLGVRFPPEYRALVEAYGSGMMGSLRLADPRRDESVEWMLRVRSELTARAGGVPVPASAGDDRFLLPVAVATNSGDIASLVVTDNEASDAEVWILNRRPGEWRQVAGSLPSLLDTVFSDTEASGLLRFHPIDRFN
ncbi:MAG: SMI1/KNR4 family protein [Acidimicrobiales bacterium]